MLLRWGSLEKENEHIPVIAGEAWHRNCNLFIATTWTNMHSHHSELRKAASTRRSSPSYHATRLGLDCFSYVSPLLNPYPSPPTNLPQSPVLTGLMQRKPTENTRSRWSQFQLTTDSAEPKLSGFTKPPPALSTTKSSSKDLQAKSLSKFSCAVSLGLKEAAGRVSGSGDFWCYLTECTDAPCVQAASALAIYMGREFSNHKIQPGCSGWNTSLRCFNSVSRHRFHPLDMAIRITSFTSIYSSLFFPKLFTHM